MSKLRYTKAQLKFFSEMGRKGGNKLLEERGTKYFSEISKKKNGNSKTN